MGQICDFVVRCKRCGENIPAPVATMPDTWIVAECRLCGEKRRYIPSEIFRGRLSGRPIGPASAAHGQRRTRANDSGRY